VKAVEEERRHDEADGVADQDDDRSNEEADHGAERIPASTAA
jgi:hypothetical protein